MKIKKQDFTEESFWAIKCPNCGEMIEVFEDQTSIWCETAECEIGGETFGGGKMNKKCKCGNDKFTITTHECEECPHNGWYNGDEYIHEGIPEGEYRDQCTHEGECEIGTNHDNGCWIFTCTKCGKIIHMPIAEG